MRRCWAVSRASMLVALVGCLSACGKSKPPPPSMPGVRVAIAEARAVPMIEEWLATLDGSTTAEIRPQVSGYIRAVNYAEGRPLRARELMFTLDKRPFVAAVAKARGDYQNAVAQLEKARADVARYEPLVAVRAVSREQLDDARAAVMEGEGNVKAMKGALESAELNLQWAEVRSPIAGLSGIAQTRVGTLVSPDQVLAVVSTIDPMRASFSVTQQDYLGAAEALNKPKPPELEEHQYFELILIDESVYPHRTRRVVVQRQIDPTTGTLQVQTLFPNPEGVLRPGLFAKVRLHLGSERSVPVVPERALMRLQGRDQVAIVDAEQRVQIRPVTPGSPVERGLVAIEKGLRAGERVIVDGLQHAQPGTKVNVVAAAKPSTAGMAGRMASSGAAAADGSPR